MSKEAVSDLVENPRALIDKGMSEREHENQVVEFAKTRGWLVFHVHDSRGVDWASDAGFPDWVFVRDGVIVFAELKKEGKNPTMKQTEWLLALSRHAYHCSRMYVLIWRPSDWEYITEVLE